MSKALLIKSYTNLTTGTQGQWNELNMASSYIQGIETGKILVFLHHGHVLNSSSLPCRQLQAPTQILKRLAYSSSMTCSMANGRVC